jgi:hypothetical protein
MECIVLLQKADSGRIPLHPTSRPLAGAVQGEATAGTG